MASTVVSHVMLMPKYPAPYLHACMSCILRILSSCTYMVGATQAAYLADRYPFDWYPSPCMEAGMCGSKVDEVPAHKCFWPPPFCHPFLMCAASLIADFHAAFPASTNQLLPHNRFPFSST